MFVISINQQLKYKNKTAEDLHSESLELIPMGPQSGQNQKKQQTIMARAPMKNHIMWNESKIEL